MLVSGNWKLHKYTFCFEFSPIWVFMALHSFSAQCVPTKKKIKQKASSASSAVNRWQTMCDEWKEEKWQGESEGGKSAEKCSEMIVYRKKVINGFSSLPKFLLFSVLFSLCAFNPNEWMGKVSFSSFENIYWKVFYAL